MRYRTRRLTALLLVFTLVFQLLPIPAFAGGSRGLPPRAQRAADQIGRASCRERV